MIVSQIVGMSMATIIVALLWFAGMVIGLIALKLSVRFVTHTVRDAWFDDTPRFTYATRRTLTESECRDIEEIFANRSKQKKEN